MGGGGGGGFLLNRASVIIDNSIADCAPAKLTHHYACLAASIVSLSWE